MRRAETLPNATVGTRLIANVGLRTPPMILGLAAMLMAIGMLLLSGCQSTPTQLVIVHESKYQNIDHTCDTIQIELKKRGFNCKGVLNLNDSMARHGVVLERQVRVVQFGKPEYAHDMVMSSPEISALMPCSFAVYANDNGRVYIASVNRTLVADMFGGTVARVMGQCVAKDQADILKAVATPITQSQRQASESISRGDPWCEMYIGEYCGR